MEAYKKLHPQRVEKKHVLDFLLFDEYFPRSVRYASVMVADFARRLSELHGARGKNIERALGKLSSRLEYADVKEIEKAGPSGFLHEMLNELGEANGLLQRSYFLQ